MFLRETLAVAAGVKASNYSIAALGELGADRRHCDIHDDLRAFFDFLEPYRRTGDFQFKAKLSRPRPLDLQVEPYAFYGRFRAWLRKRGIDPDTVDVREIGQEHSDSSD
jgi:hypothetical protein